MDMMLASNRGGDIEDDKVAGEVADMEVDKVADMVVQLSSWCKNSQKSYNSQRSKNSFKKVKIV